MREVIAAIGTLLTSLAADPQVNDEVLVIVARALCRSIEGTSPPPPEGVVRTPKRGGQ
jgi:hypothetical protein